MTQKFLSNLLFLIIINLLIKPFYIFGIDRTVQLTVGESEYGLYFALLNLTIIFNIVLDLGLQNYNNRTIAQDNSLVKTYLPNFLAAKVILGVLYFIVVMVAAWSLEYEKRAFLLLIPLALNQFLSLLTGYLRSNISGLHLFRLDAFLSIVNRLLMIVICGILLWGNVVETFKIEYLIYTETLTLSLTCLISLYFIIKYVGSLYFKIDFTLLLKIIKEGAPYALLVLLMSLYSRIDSVMLKELLTDGDAQSGIYAASYRLLDALNIFGVLFASLLLPIFAKMLKEKQAIASLAFTGFHIIFAFSVTIAVSAYFFQNPIMQTLYPDKATAYWSEIFGWLTLSFIPVASVYIFGTLLTANANLRQLNYIAFSGFLFNILLNWFLIPEYKALGATIATLSTQSIVAIIHILQAQRIFKLNFSFRQIGILLLFISIIIIANIGVTKLPLHWFLQFVIVGCFGLISALFLKLIDFKELLGLIKSKNI